MVNTNSKEFRAKVQAHIRSRVKGMGGLTGLFKDCENLAKIDRRNFYWGAYHYVRDSGTFPIYRSDILDVMHKWGLTDDKRLLKWRNWMGDVGPEYLYYHLVALNIERMYEAYLKTKAAPKKVVKKKPKTKTVTERVPMTFGMVEQSKVVKRK